MGTWHEPGHLAGFIGHLPALLTSWCCRPSEGPCHYPCTSWAELAVNHHMLPQHQQWLESLAALASKSVILFSWASSLSQGALMSGWLTSTSSFFTCVW